MSNEKAAEDIFRPLPGSAYVAALAASRARCAEFYERGIQLAEENEKLKSQALRFARELTIMRARLAAAQHALTAEIKFPTGDSDVPQSPAVSELQQAATLQEPSDDGAHILP